MDLGPEDRAWEADREVRVWEIAEWADREEAAEPGEHLHHRREEAAAAVA